RARPGARPAHLGIVVANISLALEISDKVALPQFVGDISGASRPPCAPSPMESHYNTRFLALDTPADLEAEIRTIESYVEAVPRVLRKASHRIVRVERVPAVAAMILKQELLALDGDALISPTVYLGDRDAITDALIFATLRQLHDLARRLGALPLTPLAT